MNTYDDPTRSRYGRENFPARLKSRPWLPLLLIFLVAVQAIFQSDPDRGVFIFALAIIFGGFIFRRSKVSHALPGNPADAVPAPEAGPNTDVQRLVTVLEQLEKRLVNLEEIVTQKEFDWERRLNQEPPRAAASAAASSAEPRI